MMTCRPLSGCARNCIRSIVQVVCAQPCRVISATQISLTLLKNVPQECHSIISDICYLLRNSGAPLSSKSSSSKPSSGGRPLPMLPNARCC